MLAPDPARHRASARPARAVPRPVAILRCDHELSDAEREELARQFAKARANPRLVVLTSNPDGRTVTPRR
ncbi:hypothetical protein [Amycolatopsis jiangsuensis]|uniref:Uncharacterized protein n=1 Tax=Amycolatopsis jiangsuensis TaxID=1181879 RepID=A0A840J720_9PSEU|nr:hypothetical protein [Amycolatopsis jiangsuensis]